ncbi:esterase-like activity of phytase family protein [Thermaurantiacus tibetensis]|uniref:esterase-like activity of phytase family protein n=1 Tax=Thermaurantiacus tibetensis TaxID=2759035 RepID=UPI00188F130D|nr:esterase-like activity of phytase family protein [Thermaurantiacus tibetensis]
MTFGLKLLAAAASLAAFAAGAAYATYLVGPPIGPGALRPLAIASAPVLLDAAEPARDRVGRLRFLGGLALSAPDKGFGGLSSLLWEPACGRLLAVTDAASWVILVPEEAGDRLVGVRQGWIAPIRDAYGRRADRKYHADAEAVMRDPATGETMVWFELDHRAQRYRGVSACAPESLETPAHGVDRPEGIRRWTSNKGVEAAAPDGNGILLLAEGTPAEEGAKGEMAALRLRGGAAAPLRYPAPEGLLATASAELAPGKHLVLQRRPPWPRGLLVTVSLLTDAGDGSLARTEIARFAPPLLVENFEGLALRNEGGRTFLYLVSDDNFLPAQRTLFLKFELLPAEEAGPG